MFLRHGRDNRLVVWKVAEGDETNLSTALPLDETTSDRAQPWMLHVLEVNTMNFCSFASCASMPDGALGGLLVAVPNTLASESVSS
jgi:ASTRA-associated protein 1